MFKFNLTLTWCFNLLLFYCDPAGIIMDSIFFSVYSVTFVYYKFSVVAAGHLETFEWTCCSPEGLCCSRVHVVSSVWGLSRTTPQPAPTGYNTNYLLIATCIFIRNPYVTLNPQNTFVTPFRSCSVSFGCVSRYVVLEMFGGIKVNFMERTWTTVILNFIKRINIILNLNWRKYIMALNLKKLSLNRTVTKVELRMVRRK